MKIFIEEYGAILIFCIVALVIMTAASLKMVKTEVVETTKPTEKTYDINWSDNKYW